MFLLQTESSVLDKIYFQNTSLIPNNIDIYIQEFYSLPNTITLMIGMGENAIFPDIFLKPYPMVSEMIMGVMKLYRIKTAYRRLILVDSTGAEFKTYYLLYLDENKVSLFRDFEIKREKDGSVICKISLDFAESILSRNAKGIQLIESKKEVFL